MNTTIAVRRALRETLFRHAATAFGRHPEWWSLTVAAVAWVAVVRTHWNAAPICHAPLVPWTSRVASWSLMTVAMMVPMVVPAIRGVARRSVRNRADRAMAIFLLGYLAPWLAIGALLSVTAPASRWAGAAGFAVAAGWQLTAAKRRALGTCHRTPLLAPEGWPADRDCAAFGWSSGLRCVASCWALMLTCFLAGHSLFALLTVTGVSAGERYLLHPDQRVMSAVLLTAAVLHVVIG